MAPPPDDLQKDEWDPLSWPTQDSFDATIVTTATSSSQVIVVSMAFSTQSPGDNDDSQTRRRPTSRPDGYPSTLPWPPYAVGPPTSATNSWETSVSTTAGIAETPYPEAGTTLPLSVTGLFPGTPTGASLPTEAGPFGGRPSGWDWAKKDSNKTPIYAAAAAVPIIILSIIGAIAFVCLRRRKKRKAEAAAHSTAQEMKTGPQNAPTVRAHMAPAHPQIPAVSVSRAYNAPPAHLPPMIVSSEVQPIILGPIGSSSNGAYLTGMDTSDMVSITSNNQIGPDPFADNHSIMGPPPPYRPSSAPPPSFMSNSRQSSLRAPVSPLCSRGMERSPFDDPDETMSVVSDLSVQHEPYTTTYAAR